MDDSTLITVCGLAALAVVIVMLAALVMLRVLRFGVFGFANLIMRMLSEPKDEADVADMRAQAVPRIDPTDVRGLTETLDFDAAVERARQEKEAEQSDALIEPKPFIPDPPEVPPPSINTNSPVDNRLNRDQRFPRVDGGDGPITGA